MKIIILVLFSSVLIVGCSRFITVPAKNICKKNYCVVSADTIILKYQQTDNKRLLLHLSAKTTGWVAVGFGATDYMKDANIIMGYIDNKGKVVISNEYGTSKRKHETIEKLGGYNEVKIISGDIKNGWTNLIFTIPLIPKDSHYGKTFKLGEKMRVILAYSKNGNKNFTSSHKLKAKVEIDSLYLPYNKITADKIKK